MLGQTADPLLKGIMVETLSPPYCRPFIKGGYGGKQGLPQPLLKGGYGGNVVPPKQSFYVQGLLGFWFLVVFGFRVLGSFAPHVFGLGG